MSAQRCSPAAARRIEVSINGLRARWVRACLAGSTPDSSRELASAITAIRTSVFSTAHFEVGGIQSS